MIKALLKTVLPKFTWDQKARWLLLRKIVDRAGYTIAHKADYYSPLPSVGGLRANVARWNRPSNMTGVQFDLERMKEKLGTLLVSYLDEFMALPPYAEMQKAGFGPGYTAVDALTLYMMVRQIKPRRYIEVGSGLSTYYCSLAAERNAAEGFPMQITCIEPYPFDKLRTIKGITVLAQEVQDVARGVFEELESGDVFFIDSSHILKIDGDVPFLYLEVLPTIKVGVHIHIHDIPFPYNIPYPPSLWIFDQVWPVFWNEAMLVQALLSYNSSFRMILSTPLLRHFDETFLKGSIPIYESVAENPNTFSSLWLERVA